VNPVQTEDETAEAIDPAAVLDEAAVVADDTADSADPAAEPVPVLDDPAELAAALEAVLFVLDAPVPVTALAAALERPTPAVAAALEELRRGYDDRQAGIELREVAGGVRLYTRPAFAPVVEKYLRDGQRSRLTQAALETLAVIAYRQPVTRARVAAIRGVNVDGVVRTLVNRGLISEVGSDPETGGGLFATTDLFLEKVGLQSLAELPSLAPLLPDLDTLDDDTR
jgi:segregation and condensation protein B